MDGKNGETEGKKGISRRDILKAGVMAGGLLLVGKLSARKAFAQVPANCPPGPTPWALTPYIDPLPIPGVLKPTMKANRVHFYNFGAEQFLHQFHSGLPPTPVWGYAGVTPGPVIEVPSTHSSQITVTNNLSSFVVCPDLNVMGAVDVPYIVVHGHGILDRDDSDGFAEDRFPPGVSYTYEYPNIQRPSMYWFHDHSLGLTRVNVYSGLAGVYIVRDPCEEQLGLPRGNNEIPLVIQDREFNDDGSLWFANPWMPEFFGNNVAVNGTIWPFLNVKRGKYRFRILNGSNARFYNLQLNPPPPLGAFVQIGSEGGFLPAPVDLMDPASTPMNGLLIAPAERPDVIIDFSVYPPGTEVTLTNNAAAPFPGGIPETPGVGAGAIMKFIVGNKLGFMGPMPTTLPAFPVIPAPIKTRYNTLVDFGSPLPGYPPPPATYPYPTLLLNNLDFTYPPTETPKAGSTELWWFINLAPDSHPMHIHETQFQIVGRQSFDVNGYLAANPTLTFGVPIEPFLTGTMAPPYPFESGLKDTVRSNPLEATLIKVPFGPFRGRFVWHCHIVDHEDNSMMRPLLIT